MIGKTLGHYQITSQLGTGGMGEVYQAKDQKLGRDVAIKVLPEEFAKDADRVSRFQREAKLLASLNHPNIAAIYGLEESSGTNFLVLELVEGDTLADRIKADPVPVEEALKLALQIAEALEAAHEKGVIHRDLKPANIKVTPDGKVKVLDFGLAKAFVGEQADLNLSNSPTLSNAATQQGVILGTAAYMSPEQARGKSVDKRADIWAFGCVLYEMLTGRQTWTGPTVTDIIAAALAKDPDFGSLPPNLHPRLRELLSRCLQKDPTERIRDVGDIRIEIKQILADSKGAYIQSATSAESRTRLRTILPWIAAAVVLTAIIAAIGVWKFRPPEPRQVVRFYYEVPQGQISSGALGMMPVLGVSPDGKQFVYGTSNGLYLRSANELDAKLIAGTEGPAMQPFFSPDGKWIGYHSVGDRKLKKIAINGGVPIDLAIVATAGGANWNSDGTIVYSEMGVGIRRISEMGGTPELLIKANSDLLGFPQILPGGKSVLYSANIGTPQSKIMVRSLTSAVGKELLPGNAARYLPTGHLVYSVGNVVSAVLFDPETLEVAGGPVPVIEDVFRRLTPQYAVSESGTLVYIQGTARGNPNGLTLVWVDREGKEEPLSAPPDAYCFPKISPDGTKVALTIGGPMDADLWIWDLVGKNMRRFTSDKTSGVALWTPDGRRIVYASEGYKKIFWKAADGTGKSEFLASAPDLRLYPWSWADNGKILVLDQYELGGNDNIGIVSMEGDRKWKPLLQAKYSERQGQISPGGKWIAYTSNESGRNEVYVRPFPDVDGGWWQVSTSGGENPLWSPDGRELLYRTGDAVMAVPVRTDRSFSYESPNVLFRGTYLSPSKVVGTLWDISPDGKRFLMIKESGLSQTPPKINIVLNWFEELKQRVPVK